MPLTLIIGPMKSGKSLELIARVAPYKYADKKVVYIQPAKNVRDESISSRIGVDIEAKKVTTLTKIKEIFDVIGIDEAHMFKEKDYVVIKKWLKQNKEVFITGLDLDYRGKMMPIIKRLQELKPEDIIIKSAVCENCKNYSGCYTQILYKNKVISKGLPAVVPDDGTYTYEVRCRDCFIN